MQLKLRIYSSENNTKIRNTKK